MSLGALFIVTPTVGWAAPLLWPVVLAAAGALGYQQLTASASDSRARTRLEAMAGTRTFELTIETQVTEAVAEELGRDRSLTFSRDDIVLTFARDLRGKFSIQVTGPEDKSRRQLEALAREFLGVVVQQFAYNKMAEEMERRGANVVGEEVTEEGDIVLKLRRWE